jgi:hypothetical protein
MPKSNKYQVMSPSPGSTPRLTDWLTVSRNVTWAWRTDEIREDRSRAEIRGETSSAKTQKTKRERWRGSQAAPSGRRYFRVIVVVTVNDSFNKQLRLSRNPLFICHGTPDTWKYFYVTIGRSVCRGILKFLLTQFLHHFHIWLELVQTNT